MSHIDFWRSNTPRRWCANSFKHVGKLRRGGAIRRLWPDEAPTLQPLGVERHAQPVVPEDLDKLAALAAEYVEIATEWLCCAQHNRTYVSEEIMWRTRPRARQGRPRLDLSRHIIVRCCQAAAGRRRSAGIARCGHPRRPPSRVPGASSRHPRRRSGGSWRPEHGQARLGS